MYSLNTWLVSQQISTRRIKKNKNKKYYNFNFVAGQFFGG